MDDAAEEAAPEVVRHDTSRKANGNKGEDGSAIMQPRIRSEPQGIAVYKEENGMLRTELRDLKMVGPYSIFRFMTIMFEVETVKSPIWPGLMFSLTFTEI